MKRRFTYCLLVVCLLALGLGLRWGKRAPGVASSVSTKEPAQSPASPTSQQPISSLRTQMLNIGSGSSFYVTIKKAGLAPSEIFRIISAAEAHYDLSTIPAGTPVELSWDGSQLKGLTVFLSKVQELQLLPNANSEKLWNATLLKNEVRSTPVVFSGEIATTLWDSAVGAGMPVEVIYRLSEIFAWQIDFSRELTSGDTWRVLIEKQTVKGEAVGFGPILTAEMTHRASEYSAFRFGNGEHVAYYDLEGNSLQGRFLKSPLRYSRITSRFQHRRFHPILKINRAHKGVDYAAPTGTPVHAVGDGEVVNSGWEGGSGKMVKLRHGGHYMTAYKHLSRIAPAVRRGARIVQGQVVGFVGQTGLATGPHLHFEFYEGGQYVDPLGKRFPRIRSVVSQSQSLFQKETMRLTLLMRSLLATSSKPKPQA